MGYLHLLLLLFFFIFPSHLYSATSKLGHLSATTDREALLSFKLQVDPQNTLSGWTQNSSHCSWYGVSCSSSARVQSLQLPGLGLLGTVSPHLSNLTSLLVLDLSNNSLHGQIPLELGNLPSLSFLALARNHFHGKIPSELGRLRNLQQIQLSENHITGNIPHSIWNISSLVFLSVTQNNLTGKLGMDIGHSLPNLRHLHMAQNNLEGMIPSSISNASNIEFLDLSRNNFQGSVPLFGNMKKLVMLDLGLNHLSSTTAQNLQLINSLTNCTQLETLRLFSNLMTGELPSSVANLSIHLQSFCVDDNRLTGSFPRGIDKYHNLISLSVEENYFTGQIPKTIGTLKRLQKFTLHQNRFSGEIPDVFGNFTQLYALTMGHNQFSGRIPPTIGDCKQLSTLGLMANRLNGSIPKEIFGLSSLNDMRLAQNTLQGPLPSEVGNLKQLQDMDVSDNQLSGNLSISIGSCSNLRFLIISSNNISGSIPSSIGDLTSLESLDLSSNSFSGQIPKELEELQYLLNINLSYNHLEGEVPTKGVFKNLTQVSLQGNNRLCGSYQEIVRKLGLSQCITRKRKSRYLPKIILLVSCIAFLIGAMFCAVWAPISRKKKNKKDKGSGLSSLLKGMPPMISYSDIRIATQNFAAENLIGKGGFGSVYKGVFTTCENETNSTSSNILAIKVLDLQQSKASQSFNAECEALRNVRHRNLVKVITSCSSIDYKGDDFKALVMEFMPNGNLDKWLYSKDTEPWLWLTLLQRLNIAIDIASAIDYLHHDCDPPVVHCDLKPGNILLDEDMAAHVGDFGLSRFVSQNPSHESSTIGLKGSIGYIALEYGQGGKASTNGDVYSYGILLLEMFIAKRPTDGMFEEGLSLNKFASAVNQNKVLEVADSRLFKDNGSFMQSSSTSYSSVGNSSTNNSSTVNSDWVGKGEECVAAVIRVGLSCAAQLAKDRLTMRETLTKLHEIKKFLLAL